MTTSLIKKNLPEVWLPVSKISVYYAEAQRGLQRTRVDAIKENFDPEAVGTLIVCRVKGTDTYHIVDGQHRRTAILELWGEAQRVPCRVVEVEDSAEAARLFLLYNAGRTKPSALDMFLIGVEAENEAECEVMDAVTAEGYDIGLSTAGDKVACVGALMRIHRKHGPRVIQDALRCIKSTWGLHANGATDTAIVEGMATICAKYNGQMDRKRLADRVGKTYTPARLVGAARSAREMFRGSLYGNVATVLTQTYNHGLRAEARLTDDAA